jgi:flavodoxin I
VGKILIAYGTNSNGTLFAAQMVSSVLQSQGHTVDLQEVRNTQVNSLKDYDLIIFGTNTWFYNKAQGQPHIWFFPFEEEFRKESQSNKKFAIFALGDSSYIEFCHSADYLEKMVKDMEGNLVTNSLRIDGYYFDEKKNNLLLENWASQLSSF